MAPQKPKQHDINLLSEKQLEKFIVSIGWVICSLSPDYGEDYLVYIFDEDGSRTGNTFFIQLKGSDDTNGSKLKRTEHFSIGINSRHIKEWQLHPIPVILIFWDVNLEIGYWLDVQSYTEDQLVVNPNWLSSIRETVQVRIPSSQVLDSSSAVDFVGSITDVCDARGLKFLEYRRELEFWGDSFQKISEQISLPRTAQQHRDLAVIEAVIASNPDNAQAWERKAHILYGELNDMEGALYAINQAIRLDPSNQGYIWIKACALAEYAIDNGGHPTSMLEEAFEIFSNFEHADEASKNYNIGNSLAGLGRHLEAGERFDLALQANPPDHLCAQIWKNKGTSLFHLGQHTEEFACYEKALELNPDLWQAFSSWATTEMRLGNYQHAEELLSRAIEISPAVAHYGYEQTYWLAYCQWRNKKIRDAYQTIESVLAQKPAYGDARRLKAFILAELWRADLETYKDIALGYFTTLFLDEPNNPMVQLELFLLYEKLDEIERARGILEHTLTLHDVPAQALYHHAMQLKQDGRIPEAIDAMEMAFEKSQEHHIVHNMAHLKKSAEEYREAIRFYQLAKDECSNPTSIDVDIADCYLLLQEYGQCVDLMISLLREDPSNLDWWGNLGFALSELNFSNMVLDELVNVHRMVAFTIGLGQPIDGMLNLEINRLFQMIEKVMSTR